MTFVRKKCNSFFLLDNHGVLCENIPEKNRGSGKLVKLGRFTRFYISVLIIPAVIALTAPFGASQEGGPMVEAKFVGFHSYPAMTRLVFDTGGLSPDKFRYSYRQEDRQVVLAPLDGLLAFSFAPVNGIDETVKGVDFIEDDSGRRGIVIQLGEGAQGIRASYLKQPERIVIDVYKNAKPGSALPIVRPVRTVALDPGHGGRSVGSGSGRLAEKDVALDIAIRIKGILEKAGYKVIMVRYGEKEFSPEDRAGAADSAKADLYLAIHAAGSFSKVGGGVSFFVSDSGAIDNGASPKGPALWRDQQAPYLPESLRLARSLSGAMGKIYDKDPVTRDLRLSGMDGLAMPAVMVEVGDLDDPTQADTLSEDSFRNRIAGLLAVGIGDFAKGKNE